MKKLENVLHILEGHLVLDCCKRTKPNALTGKPPAHTYYMNLYLAHMQACDKGTIDVTCEVCKSVYHIPQAFIWDEIQKYEGS